MKQKILDHFRRRDRRIYQKAVKIGLPMLPKKDKPENYFFRLCREIICQQLSNRAADVILARFEALFSNKVIRPEHILKTPHENLRKVGMSHAKARYVRNVAEAVSTDLLNLQQLDALDDEEVVRQLTKIKGIGRWTAEMFLMFTLGRENVFSFGDLGLRKAIMKVYGLRREPTQKKLEQLVIKWSPYQTYAALVLWETVDNNKP